MSLLKNAIRDGLRKGIGDAIGKAVKEAVEPAATRIASDAVEAMDKASSRTRGMVRQTSGWESTLGNLQRSVEDYATEVAKNIKICPKCDTPANAGQTFCPQCGARLPEITVAQGTVCPSCGKQNSVSTKFCSDCGAKLPAVIQEETEKASRDQAVMAQWEAQLDQFPKWNCGGSDFNLESDEPGYYRFTANFWGENNQAHIAVREYRNLLQQNGFRQAGQYPSIEHLYKKVNGICYHVDTEHCFEGDPDQPTIGFDTREPLGGFDYVKPQPKKKASIFDLFP